MFAIVRTGGKQYRVAAGDKIAVEKLSGEAGDKISLGDILLAGDGDKAQDVKGLTVSAEIIAQERGEKVIVFKKRRRHNYRRKQGHRQSLTLLRILAVGKEEKKAAAPKAEAAPAKEAAPKAEKAAAPKKAATKTDGGPKKAAAKKEG
jgi:large subunit ribosomal protein L21